MSTYSGNQVNPEAKEMYNFREFVQSIFYIGKGKNRRAMQHLQEAKGILNKCLDIPISIQHRYYKVLHCINVKLTKCVYRKSVSSCTAVYYY